MTGNDDPRHETFLRLYAAHEPAVRSYVRSLVPMVADANDVMQEVAVVLWQKFGEYATSEDFRRWAFGVARFKVLSWQRDRMRDRHIFGTDLTELLATEAEIDAGRLERQREALRLCLEKLPAEQRQLVGAAYAPGSRIDELARRAGQTAMALYKRLHRIRMALVECTRTVMLREGWS
ncbi:MAG: sigma-70 family RNA polymerase sigma factor [Verrucomicrobia bacterium]|nr:sigma-70 family RNA polymerase sigma factor [Verrucomicrobiota bacterium]